MFTAAEILRASQGNLIQGSPRVKVNGVSINSRTLKAGNAFVAVKGGRCDGHDFWKQAVAQGARLLVVSRGEKFPKGLTVIKVPDTIKALGEIARFHRERFRIPIIAITGSAGKTTAKDLIAAVLSSRYRVLKSAKSENNQFGVPLTLFQLNARHQCAVIETGTNTSGDIAWLASIVQPRIAVFTNIGPSHLQGLKSIKGVLKEKTQLLAFTDLRGEVVYNVDDQQLRSYFRRNISQRKNTISIDVPSSVQAQDVACSNTLSQFLIGRQKFTLRSPAVHNIYNALCAICCGRLMKLSYNNISKSIKNFRFRNGRSEILKVGKIWIIDDTYNANPVSFLAAIDILQNAKIPGKKIAVCADMLELGSASHRWHAAVGKYIRKSSVQTVFTYGPSARVISQALGSSSTIQSRHCDSLSQLHRRLRHVCRAGDIVLVKGSRGMKLEQTVAFLKKRFTAPMNRMS